MTNQKEKQCPRCMKYDSTIISDTHYLCNDHNCVSDIGERTQFLHVPDKKVHFPYNQIFVNRSVGEFYRKPYLTVGTTGVKTLSL